MSATQTVSADPTGRYQIDPAHTRLGFVARHAMVTKVRGEFSDFTGAIEIDAADPTNSRAELTVQVGSLTTRQEQRDVHLLSADFFDVENFPVMTYKSTSAVQVGDDKYRLTGDLTIKDVTHPVVLELEYTGTALDPFGNVRAGFEGKAEVNRKDWNLTWNAALETGGLLVSEKVTLEIDVSAIKN